MKQAGFFILSLFVLFVISTSGVLARSGCCSHHGGVRADGCGCNDGSSLSSTCAPYYSCQSAPPVVEEAPTYSYPTDTPAVKKVILPTANPSQATISPTRKPTHTPSPTQEVKATTAPIVEGVNSEENESFWTKFFRFLFGN